MAFWHESRVFKWPISVSKITEMVKTNREGNTHVACIVKNKKKSRNKQEMKRLCIAYPSVVMRVVMLLVGSGVAAGRVPLRTRRVPGGPGRSSAVTPGELRRPRVVAVYGRAEAGTLRVRRSGVPAGRLVGREMTSRAG